MMHLYWKIILTSDLLVESLAMELLIHVYVDEFARGMEVEDFGNFLPAHLKRQLKPALAA